MLRRQYAEGEYVDNNGSNVPPAYSFILRDRDGQGRPGDGIHLYGQGSSTLGIAENNTVGGTALGEGNTVTRSGGHGLCSNGSVNTFAGNTGATTTSSANHESGLAATVCTEHHLD